MVLGKYRLMRYFIVYLLLINCSLLMGQSAVLADFSNIRPIHVEASENHVTIQIDNGPTALTNPLIQLILGEGIEYVPGSIMTITGGMVQYTGTDPNQPQFTISGGLPGSGVSRFTFLRKANCASRDHKNGGGTFDMTVSLTDGSTAVTLGGVASTIPDDVIYGTVNILMPTNTPPSVNQGETIVRTVDVLNGNFGSLDSFYYRDILAQSNAVSLSNFVIDPGGLDLSVPAAQIMISPTMDSLTICFGINEIQAISGLASNSASNINNDWFDQNERFTLSYEIVPSICSAPEGITSELISFWGGDGEICTKDAMGGDADFTTSTALSVDPVLPDMEITQLTDRVELSYCMNGPGSPIKSQVQIVNKGDAPANNFFWEYTISGNNSRIPTGYRSSRIDTNSIMFKVGINGTPQSPTLTGYDASTSPSYSSCFDSGATGSTPVIRQAGFNLPSLAPGDTIFIEVEIYRCCINNCDQYTVNEELVYYYQYDENCLNLTYDGIERAIDDQYIAWNDIVEGPAQVVDGESACFTMTNVSSRGRRISRARDDAYGDLDAHIQMEYTLPAGLDASDNILENFFIVSEDFADTIYASSITKTYPTVIVDYPIPPGHTNSPLIPLGYFVVAKLTADCSIPGATFGAVNINRQIRVIRDATNDCTDNCDVIPIKCDNFTTFLYCPAPCPDGINLYQFDMERVSIGGLDDDNNGTWDDGVSPPGANARLDRAIFGDTLGLTINMAVATSPANPSFAYGHAILTWEHISSYATSPGDAPATMTVKKADGTIINCPDVIPVKVGSQLIYTFDCGGPYMQDDSIFLKPLVRITERNRTRREAVEAVTRGGNTGDYTQDLSGCVPLPQAYSLIQSYFTTYGPTAPLELNGCPERSFYHAYYYSVGPCCSNYNGGNLFPFEYRGLTYVDSVYIDLPVGLDVFNWTVTNNRTGGTRVSVSDPTAAISPYRQIPKPGAPDYTRYYFDVGSLYDVNGGTDMMLGDEGWRLDLRFRVRPNCLLENGITYPANYVTANGTDWKPGIVRNEIDYRRAPGIAFDDPSDPGFPRSSPNIIYDGGSIILTTNTPLIESGASGVSWNATVNSFNQDAENAWLYIEIPNSGYTNLVVMNTTSGATITPDANGFYRLGTLGAGTLTELKITGDVLACSLDSIYLYSDFNCGDYPMDFGTLTCTPQRVTLRSDAGVSRISATIQAPPSASYDLCEPIDISMDLLSALNGEVVDVAFDFILPTNSGAGGFTYVANSGTIEYPIGTAPRPWDPAGEMDFANQFTSGSTTISADLTDLDPANFSSSMGLSKSSEAPNNQAVVRFQVEATCAFVSGSNFQFRIFGNDPCGDPALGNGEIVQGFDVDINGVSTPYFTVITLDVDNPVAMCTQEVRYVDIDVTKIGTGATSADDIIEVILPSFMAFSPSATNPVNCTSTFCPSSTFTTNTLPDGRQSITWNWPAGMANGDMMSFEIPVRVTDFTVDCSLEASIDVITTALSGASCDGTPCTDFKVGTGMGQGDIVFQKGEFVLADLEVDANCTNLGDNMTISLSVTNNGSNIDATQPTVINFYYDADGNGVVSPGEMIVMTESISGPIASGSTISFNQSYNNVDLTQYCPLIAAIEPATSCTCDEVILASPSINYDNLDPTLAICSSDTVMLGCTSTNSNFSYMWLPISPADADAIQSPTSATTDFVYRNNTGADILFRYELITTLGTNGCVPRDTVEITIYPEAEVPFAPNSPTMCSNGTPPALMITAPTGTSIEWYDAPDGMLIGTGTSYTPSGTFTTGTYTFYALSRTNDHSCPSFDSIPVTLTVSEQLNIGLQDTSICAKGRTLSIPITPTLTGGTGSFTHQWRVVSSSVTGFSLTDVDQQTVIVNIDENTSAGTIFLEYENTDTNGNCVTTEQMAINLQRGNCGGFPWNGN